MITEVMSSHQGPYTDPATFRSLPQPLSRYELTPATFRSLPRLLPRYELTPATFRNLSQRLSRYELTRPPSGAGAEAEVEAEASSRAARPEVGLALCGPSIGQQGGCWAEVAPGLCVRLPACFRSQAPSTCAAAPVCTALLLAPHAREPGRGTRGRSQPGGRPGAKSCREHLAERTPRAGARLQRLLSVLVMKGPRRARKEGRAGRPCWGTSVGRSGRTGGPAPVCAPSSGQG